MAGNPFILGILEIFIFIAFILTASTKVNDLFGTTERAMRHPEMYAMIRIYCTVMVIICIIMMAMFYGGLVGVLSAMYTKAQYPEEKFLYALSGTLLFLLVALIILGIIPAAARLIGKLKLRQIKGVDHLYHVLLIIVFLLSLIPPPIVYFVL